MLRMALAVAAVPAIAGASAIWSGYAGDAQHSADSSVASQSLQFIRWQTAVDLNPQFDGNDLYIHYGSVSIAQDNTVIVPVKTGAADGFQMTAFNGGTGQALWTASTDYVLPPHNWTPSYSPALTASNKLYYAGAGGTVYSRDLSGGASATVTQTAFFGNASYAANQAAYNSNVFIDTPITSDAAGNIYFGYTVTGSTPGGLQSGIARISASGSAVYMPASTLGGTSFSLNQIVQNCAPAVSKDGSTVYVTVSNGGSGALVALNSSTLAPVARVALNDPSSGNAAWLNNDGSASPTIGPDGDVYIGVLENPFPANHDRGWLLHFSGDLTQTKTPGAFGWDDTASVVPASMVKSYHGPSSYLLMTKYNNYADPGLGGDGVNKIAIVDPNDTEVDPITGQTVMKVVMSIAGVTPDPDNVSTTNPNAVREWCINSAVVDPQTDSILANSEDGKLYRWDLSTDSFTQVVTLTPGVGEAYTPTVIGADGTVYAINDATLFAVGSVQVPEPSAAAIFGIIAACGLWRTRRLSN